MRERNCDDAKSTHLLLLTVVRVRLHSGDAARRICGNGRGRHPEPTVLAEMLGVGCVHYLWPWKGRRQWIGHGVAVYVQLLVVCMNSCAQKFCEHFVSVRCRCSQNAHRVLAK